MDKCPSGEILGQTISALLRRIFGHINNSVTTLCVCVSIEQLVLLSQMSDPHCLYTYVRTCNKLRLKDPPDWGIGIMCTHISQ